MGWMRLWWLVSCNYRNFCKWSASTRSAAAATRRRVPRYLSILCLHSFTRSTQPCIPPGSLNRVPASVGNVTSAGWQVTLCDPMWHVSSRSGAATLRTAIHFLLTYLPMACRVTRWSGTSRSLTNCRTCIILTPTSVPSRREASAGCPSEASTSPPAKSRGIHRMTVTQ